MNALPVMLLSLGVSLPADAKALREPAQKPVKPLPAVKQPFRLTVQEKPKFAKQPRPEASEPSTSDGLSVTIQPQRKEFAGNGPLAFEVVLKNESAKPFLLYGAEHLGRKPKLVVANLKTAAQWSLSGEFADAAAKPSVLLAAGKSLTYTVVVESQVAAVRPQPRPVPLPQPVPKPVRRPKALEKKIGGAKIQIDRRRPIVVARPNLPTGRGKCRARLLLEFVKDPSKRQYGQPHWTGRIATKPVDFLVGQPRPIGVPPVAGQVTKQQAIQQARVAAERALTDAYKPAPPARPEHTGAWIRDGGKSAQVTENKGRGWTVRWTHFPKGKGFSYNVTVDVGRRGGAVVREVFAGYSAR